MTTQYVDLEALNLRSSPEVATTNRIGVLHLGQQVDVEGDPVDGWLPVTTGVGGAPVSGFVKGIIAAQPATGMVDKPSLRDPVSDSREALVAQAVAQWVRFDQGQGKETVDPFFRFVGEMWQAIGLNLDGRDTDVPWSAACISFIVRHAAATVPAYARFKFAAAHSRYLHASIVARNGNDTTAPFWGFRLNERPPQIGDIIGKWRETPRTYDDAAATDAFKAHSDIVVSISQDFVLAIGGNVDDSVSVSQYAKTPGGTIAAVEGAFMLMANRTDA
jgi:hypothetical protein